MVHSQVRTATILLAEDNPADQVMARRALEGHSARCDLRIVSDGEEAMDYLLGRGKYRALPDRPVPDLILLDLNMPKLDGRQVLRQVKADPTLNTIPVVVLTTSSYEVDVSSSYELGCNSFIQKPVDLPHAAAALHQLRSYWLELVVLPTARRFG